MQISALQMQPTSCGKVENLELIRKSAHAAVGLGSDLLVAPEMSVTGYAIWNEIIAMAEPRDGYITNTLLEIASKLNIAIVAGMPELDGSDIYNTAICALPSGSIYSYRKCHLFGPDENSVFKKGNKLSPIFEIGGIKCGLLICYDVEFPEWARSLALAGAELFIVPTALPKNTANDRVSRLMVPTRALENHVAVVYAGLCGSEADTDYQGGSCIVGPDGADLMRADYDPGLLTVQINKITQDTFVGDPYISDRRPDLYRPIVGESILS